MLWLQGSFFCVICVKKLLAYKSYLGLNLVVCAAWIINSFVEQAFTAFSTVALFFSVLEFLDNGKYDIL